MLNYDHARSKECLSYEMFKVFSSLVRILVKVLNSPCLWLLGKVIPDLQQCALKLLDIVPFQ